MMIILPVTDNYTTPKGLLNLTLVIHGNLPLQMKNMIIINPYLLIMKQTIAIYLSRYFLSRIYKIVNIPITISNII